MNTEKAQNAINELVLKNRLDRQYPASKKQIAELTELGLIDFMPICKHPSVRGIGYTDAAAVISAAKESGKSVGGFNADGEGDVVRSNASDLYKAIHEVEITPEPEPEQVSDFETTGSLFIRCSDGEPGSFRVESTYDTYEIGGGAYLRRATRAEAMNFVVLEMSESTNRFEYFDQWLYVVMPEVYSQVTLDDLGLYQTYGVLFKRERRGLFGELSTALYKRAELCWREQSPIEFVDAIPFGNFDLVTPAQAAEMTQYAESTWRNYCAQGRVRHAVKHGKQWLIPRAQVEFCAKHGFGDHEEKPES